MLQLLSAIVIAVFFSVVCGTMLLLLLLLLFLWCGNTRNQAWEAQCVQIFELTHAVYSHSLEFKMYVNNFSFQN
jgi:hypothetical protein